MEHQTPTSSPLSSLPDETPTPPPLNTIPPSEASTELLSDDEGLQQPAFNSPSDPFTDPFKTYEDQQVKAPSDQELARSSELSLAPRPESRASDMEGSSHSLPRFQNPPLSFSANAGLTALPRPINTIVANQYPDEGLDGEWAPRGPTHPYYVKPQPTLADQLREWIELPNPPTIDYQQTLIRTHFYQVRADEIGDTHGIPGVESLEAHLTPPGWTIGHEPATDLQVERLYKHAISRAWKLHGLNENRIKQSPPAEQGLSSARLNELIRRVLDFHQRVRIERVHVYRHWAPTLQARRFHNAQRERNRQLEIARQRSIAAPVQNRLLSPYQGAVQQPSQGLQVDQSLLYQHQVRQFLDPQNYGPNQLPGDPAYERTIQDRLNAIVNSRMANGVTLPNSPMSPGRLDPFLVRETGNDYGRVFTYKVQMLKGIEAQLHHENRINNNTRRLLSEAQAQLRASHSYWNNMYPMPYNAFYAGIPYFDNDLGIVPNNGLGPTTIQAQQQPMHPQRPVQQNEAANQERRHDEVLQPRNRETHASQHETSSKKTRQDDDRRLQQAEGVTSGTLSKKPSDTEATKKPASGKKYQKEMQELNLPLTNVSARALAKAGDGTVTGQIGIAGPRARHDNQDVDPAQGIPVSRRSAQALIAHGAINTAKLRTPTQPSHVGTGHQNTTATASTTNDVRRSGPENEDTLAAQTLTALRTGSSTSFDTDIGELNGQDDDKASPSTLQAASSGSKRSASDSSAASKKRKRNDFEQ